MEETAGERGGSVIPRLISYSDSLTTPIAVKVSRTVRLRSFINQCLELLS